MKKAVISALFNTDKITDQIGNFKKMNGWDYILYIYEDQILDDFGSWNIKKIKKIFDNNIIMAKYIKWMTHKILPEYDIIMWVDAFLSPNIDKEEEINEIADNFSNIKNVFPLTILKNLLSKDSYQVLINCVICKKITNEMANKSRKYLEEHGLERNSGSYWSCSVIKNNKDKNVINVSEEIFNLINTICYRDQIWITFVFKKYNVKPKFLIDYTYIKHSGKIINHNYV